MTPEQAASFNRFDYYNTHPYGAILRLEEMTHAPDYYLHPVAKWAQADATNDFDKILILRPDLTDRANHNYNVGDLALSIAPIFESVEARSIFVGAAFQHDGGYALIPEEHPELDLIGWHPWDRAIYLLKRSEARNDDGTFIFDESERNMIRKMATVVALHSGSWFDAEQLEKNGEERYKGLTQKLLTTFPIPFDDPELMEILKAVTFVDHYVSTNGDITVPKIRTKDIVWRNMTNDAILIGFNESIDFRKEAINHILRKIRKKADFRTNVHAGHSIRLRKGEWLQLPPEGLTDDWSTLFK